MSAKTHKARDITARLRSDLQRGKWQPHGRLPSERELGAKFRTSAITVRKALANLVEEGLIYRRERFGTFVSPPVKAGQILLVMGNSQYGAGLEMLRAFTETLTGDGESIFPLVIGAGDFVAHLSDIELIYRDIVAVVFFREVRALEESREILRQKDIPFAFYGSDQVLGDFDPVNRVLACETDIVRLAYQHLARERVPLAVASVRYPVHQARARQFREFARRAKRAIPPGLDLELDFYERFMDPPDAGSHQGLWLARVAKAGASVFATGDHHAARILQHAHAQGLKVPDDFRIVGVDNAPMGEALPVGLTTVEIPVFEDGVRLCRRLLRYIRERGEPFEERSEVRMVVRSSG